MSSNAARDALTAVTTTTAVTTVTTAMAEKPPSPMDTEERAPSVNGQSVDNAGNNSSNSSSNNGETTAASDENHSKGNEDEDEDDEEEVVTLHEVLQEQSALNEAADAVLGDCSDDHCSYPMGHFRQALYACLTCTPATTTTATTATTAAAVCLACSYHCHADHELVELYTKRDFRCDCGNARFPETAPCRLCPDKAPTNDRNRYSHNFAGRYCTCQRPYPDPERTRPEVMVQCIVCEDWLHEEHIFADGDAGRLPGAFDELICRACMARHPFLAAYQRLDAAGAADGDDNDADEQDGAANDGETPAHGTGPEHVQTDGCVLERLVQEQQQQERQQELTPAVPRPTFWSREWRTRLCQCGRCVARFEREGIAFLMDPEDSLQAYEERAREQQEHLQRLQEQQQQQQQGPAFVAGLAAAMTPGATSAATSTGAAGTATTTTSSNNPEDTTTRTTIDAAMSSLEAAAQRAFQTKLTHEQQVEMAMGYNHMKEKLQSYLSTFASSGKTVRAQDIQEFFEELRESKRPRRE